MTIPIDTGEQADSFVGFPLKQLGKDQHLTPPRRIVDGRAVVVLWSSQVATMVEAELKHVEEEYNPVCLTVEHSGPGLVGHKFG